MRLRKNAETVAASGRSAPAFLHGSRIFGWKYRIPPRIECGAGSFVKMLQAQADQINDARQSQALERSRRSHGEWLGHQARQDRAAHYRSLHCRLGAMQ